MKNFFQKKITAIIAISLTILAFTLKYLNITSNVFDIIFFPFFMYYIIYEYSFDEIPGKDRFVFFWKRFKNTELKNIPLYLILYLLWEIFIENTKGHLNIIKNTIIDTIGIILIFGILRIIVNLIASVFKKRRTKIKI